MPVADADALHPLLGYDADTPLSPFPEHDPSPTSALEIWGWFSYAWSSEPFIVSAVGTFVPLLLEQFARQAGVRLDDPSKPCMEAPSTEGPLPPGLTPGGSDKCLLPLFGGLSIDTSSLALYTFSASIFWQALVVISMSGMADRSHFRKRIMVVFGVVGAVTTMSFIGVTHTHYLLTSLLAMVANCCFGAVNVCGNAFLAVLVANSPNLAKPNVSPQALVRVRHQLSARLSGTGAACGYTAALIAQVICILIVQHWSNPVLGSPTVAIQMAICFIGAWWLVFQIPVMLLMRPRPGPPLHLTPAPDALSPRLYRLWAHVQYGWVTLAQTVIHAQRLRQLMMFLLAWFFVSDSLTTINSTAILFARSNLQMKTTQLAVVGLLTVLAAIGGSLAVPRILKRVPGLLPKTALCGAVGLACCIPLYGMIGFFTLRFGLRYPLEMFVVAVVYGVVLGSVATLTRSIYATLIPTGLESTFFALFSVTDKGSSIMGPIVSGLIVDRTHELRYCFVWLLGGLVAGLAVLWWGVDIDQGLSDAQTFVYEEELTPGS